MASEMNTLRGILLHCGRGATRLFRNNVAGAWVGQSRRFSRAETVVVQPGDVLIRNARPLHAGLCEGSSDLIGWTVRDGRAVRTAIRTGYVNGSFAEVRDGLAEGDRVVTVGKVTLRDGAAVDVLDAAPAAEAADEAAPATDATAARP